MVKYVQNLLPALLKLPCGKLRYKKPPFYTFDNSVLDPIFDPPDQKMLICSALIDGPQNRPKTLKRTCKTPLNSY